MLTATIVASIGLYLLADIQRLDIARVWIVTTFLLPQLIGGMLFGSGFLLCGYCPGMLIVGFASSRLDALAVMIGIVMGSFLFAMVYPLLVGFYLSSDMGAITIQRFLGTSHWIVIIALALIGGMMFTIMDRLARRSKLTCQD